jgi:hypothetical protein
MIYSEWQKDQLIKHFTVLLSKSRNNDLEWHKQYDKYLKSEIWKEKRKEAIDRSKYTCEKCHQSFIDSSKLDVHHITYDRVGGRELPGDLKVVCYSCHRKADIKREQIVEDDRSENYYISRIDGFAKRNHGENWDLLSFDEREEEFQKCMYQKYYKDEHNKILPKYYEFENDMEFYEFCDSLYNGDY